MSGADPSETDSDVGSSEVGSMGTDFSRSAESESDRPPSSGSTGLGQARHGHGTTPGLAGSPDLNEIDQPVLTLQVLTDHLMREQQLLEDQRDAMSRLLVESHRAIEKVVAREDRIGQLEGSHGSLGAEQASARLAQAAIDTAARLQQIQQMTDGFRDDLTRLETDVRALADSARPSAARDRLEGHASEAEVNTPRAARMPRSVPRLPRSAPRWAIAAGLLLAGLTLTRWFSHPAGISDNARAENAPPLLTASALMVRPIPLMSSGPALTTAAVTMPRSMNADVVRGTRARSEFRGSLAIRSSPVGAAVFVNRRYVGDTPIQLPRWRPGTHVVWVERPGYRRWTRAVLVPADQITRVHATLASERAEGDRLGLNR